MVEVNTFDRREICSAIAARFDDTFPIKWEKSLQQLSRKRDFMRPHEVAISLIAEEQLKDIKNFEEPGRLFAFGKQRSMKEFIDEIREMTIY
ncbi:hypothetical protein DASC09_003610 [Saccharomycopsis crataegensis]|uniref:Uncharacterized protein n=1 Tax=Saccharomycopsis crataegensis TaxID=43959 RepID=A0AAV5QE65_9ASCO|nr:hypothetical protein DASC09_003610 [Saccharomycopsis crataegensis]